MSNTVKLTYYKATFNAGFDTQGKHAGYFVQDGDLLHHCPEWLEKIIDQEGQTENHIPDSNKLAEIFCRTRLPAGVSADACATMADYKGLRCGTHLLSFTEAKQIFNVILSEYYSEKAKVNDR